MARYSFRQRRLQRCFDKQQHGCSNGMYRWHGYRDVYLYKYLCTIDDDLYGHFHSDCTYGISTNLPGRSDGSGLSNSSSH